MLIRPSELSDIDHIVLLSKAKRLAYEQAQPQFWRYAGPEAEKSQSLWFRELLAYKDYIMLTAENSNKEIMGFIIGKLISAPEVYDPGGLTLMIDDFCVKSDDLWETVGLKLIKEIKSMAKNKSASQIVVVCGVHDTPKRKFLINNNLTVASEWFVGKLA